MAREWKEVPDETDEIVLQDTQEYRVAEIDDEIVEDPEGGLEEFDAVDDPDDFEGPEGPEGSDVAEEFEDEPEYEDDEFEGEYEEADEVEYYEDDVYEDEDLDEIEETREEKRPVVGEPREPFAARIKAVWAALAAQARGVDLPGLPDKPELDLKLVAPVAAIVLAALAVGIGAYAIGKGSGDDVDVARLEGEAAGRQAGAIEGATRGYAAGFVKGRDAGFEKTYVPAYRLNFKRAFEQAGLDVPADKDIDVPEP